MPLGTEEVSKTWSESRSEKPTGRAEGVNATGAAHTAVRGWLGNLKTHGICRQCVVKRAGKNGHPEAGSAAATATLTTLVSLPIPVFIGFARAAC